MTQSPIEKFCQHLIAKLASEYGIKNYKKISRCIRDKHEMILQDLMLVYISDTRHSRFPDNENIKVYWSSKYAEEWGRITIDGDQKWLNTLLPKYLFKKWHEGTNHPKVASAIEFTSPIVIDAIIDYFTSNEVLRYLEPMPLTSTGEEDIFTTKIDIDSLYDFLRDAEHNLRSKQYERDIRSSFNADVSAEEREKRINEKIGEERNKLIKNIRYARKILAAIGDDCVLSQPMSVSNAGRLYLGKVNLQRAPKEVRYAALGNAYAYDMKCGALGVMAALAHSFCDEKYGFPHIKEYIKRRNEIREKITRDIFADAKHYKEIKKFRGYYKVKEAFTAIGFGARKSANGWWHDSDGKWQCSSITDILGKHAAAFLQHPLAKNIIAEYEFASKIAYESYRRDQAFHDYLHQNSSIDAELTKTQMLAHIYQHFESVILNQLRFGASRKGAKTLLPLHDGAYFDRSINHIDIWSAMDIPFVKDMSFMLICIEN